MAKILYYGGQKSGKSLLAERKILELSRPNIPCYIATYDNIYGDEEMQERIIQHQSQRVGLFNTIEERFDILGVIKDDGYYIIDCISMWILNSMEMSIEELLVYLNVVSRSDATIVFVLNDVSSGVIPIDSISREYIDRSGILGQRLASFCDEVYEVKLGIELRIK
jgi:adenosylcobinamide kinase/adenosylcobinamide-phosphate guanylyltransferase